jgi:hypothetical protein
MNTNNELIEITTDDLDAVTGGGRFGWLKKGWDAAREGAPKVWDAVKSPTGRKVLKYGLYASSPVGAGIGIGQSIYEHSRK